MDTNEPNAPPAIRQSEQDNVAPSKPRRSARQPKPSRKVRENATALITLNAAAATGHRVLSYKEALSGPDKQRWQDTIKA